MKIAVWRTGHEIADTVAKVVVDGLNGELYATTEITSNNGHNALPDADIHIAYGILRGTAEVFRAAQQAGKPWFNIDRGYWKPGHYDGYYRISLRGTQQTTGLDKLEPDYERWEQLGLEILPEKIGGECDLVCPPTDAVMSFFNINQPIPYVEHQAIWRNKDCKRPLANDLAAAKQVITFNSSVGWEALRQGIPVVSDPDHSFIGAYQNQVDTMSRLDIDKRHRMFAVMASLQLSLEEIRQGKLWPLLNRLLSVSDTMTEKQSQVM